MRTTKEGLELIQSFEGCVLKAYLHNDSRWTIGWGRARGVRSGDTCTQEQADEWFLEDVANFEAQILRYVKDTPLTDNQLSALVSFCYNEGFGAIGIKDGFKLLINGETSTMLKCLLEQDYEGAAAEFPKWDKIGGTTCGGLLRRRMAEQALFNKPEETNG